MDRVASDHRGAQVVTWFLGRQSNLSQHLCSVLLGSHDTSNSRCTESIISGSLPTCKLSPYQVSTSGQYSTSTASKLTSVMGRTCPACDQTSHGPLNLHPSFWNSCCAPKLASQLGSSVFNDNGNSFPSTPTNQSNDSLACRESPKHVPGNGGEIR